MPPVGWTEVIGLSHTLLAEPSRPTAALADVRKVADDFVIVRTLRGGLEGSVASFSRLRPAGGALWASQLRAAAGRAVEGEGQWHGVDVFR